MKTLSVQQPWATLIVIGAKVYETRSWETGHRGPLAIHASAKFNPLARELCGTEPFRSALAGAGIRSSADLPLGIIVGAVDLEDCIFSENLVRNQDIPEWSFGDFRPGRWAWKLANPRHAKTVLKVRGRLGVFDVPTFTDADLVGTNPGRARTSASSTRTPIDTTMANGGGSGAGQRVLAEPRHGPGARTRDRTAARARGERHDTLGSSPTRLGIRRHPNS